MHYENLLKLSKASNMVNRKINVKPIRMLYYKRKNRFVMGLICKSKKNILLTLEDKF